MSESTKMDTDDGIIELKPADSPTTSRSSTPSSSSKTKRTRLTFPFGPCRVCSDSATGIHYGIATCEGCKGFFKRSILRKEKYRCYFDNSCVINVTNRNRCKSCRFRRCIQEGMSVDGVKMGRIPKLVKERALRELKEKEMREQATAGNETHERSDDVHLRESSCSSLSDRSIENYDPNIRDKDTCGSDNHLTNDRSMKYSNNQGGNLSEHNRNADFSQRKSFNFLPEDFTLDETVDSTEHSTGPLSQQTFQYVNTIAYKLSQNKSDLLVQLTDDELTFIKFLRWSAYDIYNRHSKRVKQLEIRMHQMVDQGIQRFPGDDATAEQYLTTMPKTLELLVRSSVFYMQELPGMMNMDKSSLQKLILRRSFDWFMLKYACLLHKDGQCYFVSPDGTQFTRYWMNQFHGIEMTNAMFEFSQCFRDLHLTDTEISLILPLQMCYTDSMMIDQETSQMLRACYLYALYEELCEHHGDYEGKKLCSQVLQVLDLLIPLNELYEKNVGSRVLQNQINDPVQNSSLQ